MVWCRFVTRLQLLSVACLVRDKCHSQRKQKGIKRELSCHKLLCFFCQFLSVVGVLEGDCQQFRSHVSCRFYPLEGFIRCSGVWYRWKCARFVPPYFDKSATISGDRYPQKKKKKRKSLRALNGRIKGLISKETVVLRRWGSYKQEFGFNLVDNVN